MSCWRARAILPNHTSGRDGAASLGTTLGLNAILQRRESTPRLNTTVGQLPSRYDDA
jgi:hypothetical protein